MAKKKESEDANYKVGDQITAKLHDGRKADVAVLVACWGLDTA